MKTLKNLLVFVPLSHLFGIVVLALLAFLSKDAADPAKAAQIAGVSALLSAGVCLALLSSLIGRFGVGEGFLAGAVFALTVLAAGLMTGDFSPSAPAIAALTAAILLPALFCLRKRAGNVRSKKSKKRAAARYFAK